MIYADREYLYEVIKMFGNEEVARKSVDYLAGMLIYPKKKAKEDKEIFEEFKRLKEAKYSNRDIAMILESKFNKAQSTAYRKIREFERRCKQLEFSFD